MNLILFDGPERENLLPLTYTRPVADIRIGISTLREKWESALGLKSSTFTIEYLQKKWPLYLEDINLFINPSFLPTDGLVQRVQELGKKEKLIYQNQIIAYRDRNSKNLPSLKPVEITGGLLRIEYPWDIFSNNSKAITYDFKRLTAGRTSQPIPKTFTVFNRDDIFIEVGAKLYSGSLNAENGPIYISQGAEIREGSHIRGPFTIGEGGRTQMGSRIYEGTTIGPYAVVGGEIKNVVIFGYSNKGHDGYLGNAVVGEWCNLGADTNASNLKNDYRNVRAWNYKERRFISTGLQKCGLR